MFDPERILADEVLAEFFQHTHGSVDKPPGSDLADARDPLVRVDLDKQVFSGRNRCQICNLHMNRFPLF